MRCTPCKGCTKRVLSCHSGCKEYIKWRKELDNINNKAKKSKVDVNNYPYRSRSWM